MTAVVQDGAWQRRVLGVVVGLLFVGLAVLGEGQLSWARYAGMGAALVCLAGLAVRRAIGEGGKPLVAAVLVAGGAQLSAAAAGWVSTLLWVGLSSVAVAGAALSGRPPGQGRGGLSRLEWTTLGVAAGVLLICVGSGALPGLEVRWSKALQWVLYPVAWLGVTRWLGREDSGDGGWVVGSAAAVLAGVFAVGSSEAALAYHEVRSGRGAAEAGQYDVAEHSYRRAGEISRTLGLTVVEDEARLGLAESLAGQGDMDSARAALGIPQDLLLTIPPNAWMGQTGGFLFKETSCWTDLWLWEGTVEVEIRAHGRMARDVWPRLRVELGGTQLGTMEVNSSAGISKVFETHVPTGRHRLLVSLEKGFWSSRGDHRWARLDTVGVRYLGVVR